MSAARRDLEALDVARSRSFDGTYVAAFELEMQVRRLTLRLYGSIGTAGTQLATITFFGTSAVTLQNDAGSFPESVRVASLALENPDPDDVGSAVLTGQQGWSMAWSFDGLAYEEHPAVIASLADDL